MTTETTLKQTPLYDSHLKYGGKVIDFGGWALPSTIFRHYRRAMTVPSDDILRVTF